MVTSSVNIRKCDQTAIKGVCFVLNTDFFFRTVSGYAFFVTGKKLDKLALMESCNFHFSSFMCWLFVCFLFLKFPCFPLYHRFLCLLTSGYIQEIIGIGGCEKGINQDISPPLLLPTITLMAVTVPILVLVSDRKPLSYRSCLSKVDSMPTKQGYLLALVALLPLIVPFVLETFGVFLLLLIFVVLSLANRLFKKIIFLTNSLR